MPSLSEPEWTALRQCRTGLLVSHVPDTTSRDVLGDSLPGKRIFSRLVHKGLLIETDEDPILLEDGTPFFPTPTYELTQAGTTLLAQAPY
jgi:hypothetical protein